MKGVVGEEEVDWCVVPHVPRLAVAGQRLGDGVGVDSELAEWLRIPLRPRSTDTKTFTSMSIVALGSA